MTDSYATAKLAYRELRSTMEDVAANSLLGHDLQALYDPKPQYREGHMISFGYHGLQDAREFAAFLAAVLPQALERFLQGRVATPVDRTPPHCGPIGLALWGNQAAVDEEVAQRPQMNTARCER